MTKGYHNYRGRGGRQKRLLAVVLVLVILTATAFLVIQNYIVYDDAGKTVFPAVVLGGADKAPADAALVYRRDYGIPRADERRPVGGSGRKISHKDHKVRLCAVKQRADRTDRIRIAVRRCKHERAKLAVVGIGFKLDSRAVVLRFRTIIKAAVV